MSDVKQEPQAPSVEFETIPVALAAFSMIQKVNDWRNFFLQLAIENAARMDGIDLKAGWQMDLRAGMWRRIMRPEVKDAASGTTD